MESNFEQGLEQRLEQRFSAVEPQAEQLKRVALESLKWELDLIEFMPPKGDRYLASYSYALQNLLEDTELANEWMDALYEPPQNAEALEHYHIPSPSEAYNKIVKSLQRQFLMAGTSTGGFILPKRFEEIIYPNDLADKDNCLRILDDLLHGEHSRHLRADIFIDLRSRNIASNVEERYKSAGALLGGYWDDDSPKRVYDIGSSGGVGMAMLLKPEGVSWEDFDVVADIEDPDSPTVVQDSLLLQQLAEEYPVPHKIIGVDVWRLDDVQARSWFESCSFYPSDLLDHNRRERFSKLLSQLDDERLSVHIEDFSNPEAPGRLVDGGEKADLVFMSTMLYQLNQRDRNQAIENALNCVTPNGLIVVQDFFDLHENGIELTPRENWYERPYYTYVLEAKNPQKGWQEVFIWEDGRCLTLQLGKDAGNIIKPLAA